MAQMILYLFPPFIMLWKYKMPFEGYIDGPPNIAEARRILAEKIKADPYAFINKLEPAEPSATTLLDLGKQVFGFPKK